MTTPSENINDTPPATPGLLTTEFWKSFIYAGLSILTGLGVIGPSLPDKYKMVVDSVAYLAGAVCVVAYAFSRGKTKAAAVTAAAQVQINKDYVNSPLAQGVSAGVPPLP